MHITAAKQKMQVAASGKQFVLHQQHSRGIQTQLHNPALSLAADRYVQCSLKIILQ